MLPAISDCSLIKEETIGEHEVRIPIPYRPGMKLGTAEAHHLNRKLAIDVKMFLADWLRSHGQMSELFKGDQIDLAMFEFLDGYAFEGPPAPPLPEATGRTVPVTIRLGATTLAELRRLKLTHGVSYNRLIRGAVEALAARVRENPDGVAGLEG